MGYSDQKYYARPLELFPGIAFGTATASGTNTLAAPASPLLPTYIRKSVLTSFDIVPTTAASAGVTAGTFVILNGTATAGQCAVVGAAGTAIVGTVTAANATFAAGAGPTYELILATATVSGATTGTFMAELEVNELPA